MGRLWMNAVILFSVSNLPPLALMKHAINMFDICLPSPHLLFAVDSPKWLCMEREPARLLVWFGEMNGACLAQCIQSQWGAISHCYVRRARVGNICEYCDISNLLLAYTS